MVFFVAYAVIDQHRASIALYANSTIFAALWNLGLLLHERKLESKHGSGGQVECELRRSFVLSAENRYLATIIFN